MATKWVCITLANPLAQCSGHPTRKQAWASKPCATKFGNVTRMIIKNENEAWITRIQNDNLKMSTAAWRRAR